MKFADVLRSADWAIVGTMVLLTSIGLAMLASATDTGQALSPLLYRQAIALVGGLVVIAITMKIPYHAWKRMAPILLVVGVIIQIGLSIAGRAIRGTVSRVDILGFQIQPSEFVKVILILVLALVLANYKRVGWRQIAATFGVIIIPVFFVLKEPDLGMAVLMMSSWIGMLIVFGLPVRTFIAMCLIGGLVFAGAWHGLLFDYQKKRILTFLHPTADPLRTGYNVTQSIIALGSGEVFGRGLGHGPQSQLKFLPEQHTDFILASVGEELGFVGIILICGLYGVMLWRIVLIVKNVDDPFAQLIGTGAFFLLITGFTVNAGMNMGLLPVTGIPLPFISYGGSNFITSCFLLGLVESVKIHSKFYQRAPKELSSFI
ncbi:MAG TPA: rod shape-determining protein RodA [Candidatus Andersenbacteria bacterium]|nr:rod shape-determining protein RodA [Candidatus Andersenbacteria bacterium]